MRNITYIQEYGRSSFAKARTVKGRVYRRKAAGHLAIAVKSVRANGPRYLVRLALEGKTALADCANAVTEAPCKGFSANAHCYHVCKALLSVCGR